MQLLGHAGLQRLFTNHNAANFIPFGPVDDEDIDLDDGYGGFGAQRRPGRKGTRTKPPPVPSEEGRKLMASGTFGISMIHQSRLRAKTRLGRILMRRELGIDLGNAVTTNKLLSHVNY